MRYLFAVILVFVPAVIARAEMTADEVAVIAMAKSEQSRGLAEYYVEARGIDPSRVFLLDGEPGETMSREVWESEVRPAIRAWLDEIDPEEGIRCLVTCWDVPLLIGKRSDEAPVVADRQEYLGEMRQRCVDEVGKLVGRLAQLGLDQPLGEEVKFDAETKADVLAARINTAMREAQERIRSAASAEFDEHVNTAFEQAILQGGGINGLLKAVARQVSGGEVDSQVAMKTELLKGRLGGLNDGLKAIASMPDSVSRDRRIMGLLTQAGGMIGAIEWIDGEREALRLNETQASFDSELSLLYWSEYPLLRWEGNLLHYRFDELSGTDLRVLMVSRLEAPTYELAKGLIDAAIATEGEGLSGKVYLDARGMKFDPETDESDSHAAYDQSIRDLAERLREHTELEVVLNDEATVFQEGECPDAALYCGWYSLAKYVDAFDWQRGAIGYHLAEAEASTLRTPGSRVWCNAMLEDGITATLGPTFDPGLASFPLPDDFFSLLLCGRYTLAEAYYRSKPRASWAMVLVGDPLYNPFGKAPPLSEDALPERLRENEEAESE